MQEIIIDIQQGVTNEGYIWNLYENDKKFEQGREITGGLCTGSIADAVGMAQKQVATLIEIRNDQKREIGHALTDGIKGEPTDGHMLYLIEKGLEHAGLSLDIENDGNGKVTKVSLK